ncbi:2-amino-4-hydroxy-6-hydroxymethyldihydropteridine diphosphokinase [Oleiharenicola sp. Vm1]|uniref:2-amino-4-hydroxy-6- hydroxymethyldihydropteridine diphosphokinase n=1 Tax=Oleiharenicola sp. Vm1 TaxID=3398393 RepID=UPI0039F4C37F
MDVARQAFVGVGANLGDRWGTIVAALERLRRTAGVGAVALSPVFESEPVGVLEQPLFLNLVAGLETTLSPEELLRRLQAIELALGRERRVRWGPRTIDLDLLAYEGETRTTPEIELPHPRLWERTFVVEPLRALLTQPRFAGPRWMELRRRLPAAPDERGLRRWRPPDGPAAP